MRMTFTKSTAALLAALAAPALALPAFAQTAPAPAPTAPAQTAPAPSATTPAPTVKRHPAVRREHRVESTPAQRAARVEARITSLHKQLAITTAQQPQWDTFAQVMRDNATNMEKTFDQRGSRLGSMNAADNMQSYADVAVAHAQDVQRLATAFQSLYGSFSDTQKHTADLLFRHDENKPGPKAPGK